MNVLIVLLGCKCVVKSTVKNTQHKKTILKDDMDKYPLKRYGKPEDIAYASIYLLSEASSWVTGQSIVIDGGVTSK